MSIRISPCRQALYLGIATAALPAPMAGLANADERGRRAEFRYEQRVWREGYYPRAGVYDGASPVIYPPAGYYRQPIATLDLNFPLIIR